MMKPDEEERVQKIEGSMEWGMIMDQKVIKSDIMWLIALVHEKNARIDKAVRHLRQAACQEYCPMESGMRTSTRGFSEEQEHVTRAFEILAGEKGDEG